MMRPSVTVKTVSAFVSRSFIPSFIPSVYGPCSSPFIEVAGGCFLVSESTEEWELAKEMCKKMDSKLFSPANV